MRFSSCCLAVACCLLLGSSVVAEDKADKKTPPDKPDSKDTKLIPAGEVSGKLIRVESAQKSLALQVDIPYVVNRSIQLQHVNIELQTADDVKVRTAYPPIEFDEKGNPKRYTSKQLREMKGPGNLPGYPGDFDNLKPEQIIHVYLKKPKTPPKPPGKKAEYLAENKPVVTMIYIMVEPRK